MAALTILLAAALWMSWQFAWRRLANKTDNVLRADLGYWICMFIAGTLGTVIGDFCSHNMRLDDAGAAALLSPIVAILFLIGRQGPLRLLPFYWLTVVAIRAAGTSVGDLHLRPAHARPAAQHGRHGHPVRRASRDLEGNREAGRPQPL